MATFLDTDMSGLINADCIERIYQSGKKNKYGKLVGATAVLKDGSEVGLEFSWKIGVVRHKLLPVIPATPGFVLMKYECSKGDGEYVIKSPIIAWRLHGDSVNPITPDQEETEDWYHILFPDGQVYEQSGPLYKDEDDWLKVMREEMENEAEKKEEKA